MSHLEVQLFTDALHLDIFRQNVTKYIFDVLVAAHLEKAAEQFRAQAQSLVGVADDDGEFGVVRPPDLAQTTDAEDLMLAVVPTLAVGDQGHLAVVVDEAD